MEDIGTVHADDTRTPLDRQTAHYADAFVLAIQVLESLGRNFEASSDSTWTFLIRTPKLIESGLRALLASHIPSHTIAPRGERIPNTWMTLNPDLVVDEGLAVADVKYKLTDEAWRRPDLHQIVTFAEGFKSGMGRSSNFFLRGLLLCQPCTLATSRFDTLARRARGLSQKDAVSIKRSNLPPSSNIGPEG